MQIQKSFRVEQKKKQHTVYIKLKWFLDTAKPINSTIHSQVIVVITNIPWPYGKNQKAVILMQLCICSQSKGPLKDQCKIDASSDIFNFFNSLVFHIGMGTNQLINQSSSWILAGFWFMQQYSRIEELQWCMKSRKQRFKALLSTLHEKQLIWFIYLGPI